MPFGINIGPEEYQRRQTEHVSDFPDVAVIADDHLVCGCENTMEKHVKTMMTIYLGYEKEPERLDCGSIQ